MFKLSREDGMGYYPKRIKDLNQALVQAIDSASTAQLQNQMLIEGLKKLKSKKAQKLLKKLLKDVKGVKSWK